MVARLQKPAQEPRQAAVASPAHKAEQKARTATLAQAVDAVAAKQPDPPVDDTYPFAGQEMPRSLGLCADEYHEVRTLRLSMEKVVKQVTDREAEIREHLISNLSKSDDTGAAGKKYRAQIVSKDVPKLNDWKALTAFVAEHDRFDLIQKRLSEKAVLDMLEQGEDVPGVEKMKIPGVSITKI